MNSSRTVSHKPSPEVRRLNCQEDVRFYPIRGAAASYKYLSDTWSYAQKPRLIATVRRMANRKEDGGLPLRPEHTAQGWNKGAANFGAPERQDGPSELPEKATSCPVLTWLSA